jgi:hypothetical protein
MSLSYSLSCKYLNRWEGINNLHFETNIYPAADRSQESRNGRIVQSELKKLSKPRKECLYVPGVFLLVECGAEDFISIRSDINQSVAHAADHIEIF